MDNPLAIGLVVVLVIAAAIGITVAVVKYRYAKSLRDKGWTFVTSPNLGITAGLNAPPFGIGFDRKVDDQVMGTAPNGVPFSLFEYSHDQVSEERLVRFPLPHALPWWATDAPSNDPGYDQAVRAALSTAPQTSRVSIDGNSLIIHGAPKKADEIEAFLRVTAPAAAALNAANLTAWRCPDPPQHFGFFGTTWRYDPVDNNWLGATSITRGGESHVARNVITGDHQGLQFVAFLHTWTTTHTTVVSTGNGSSVRTTTVPHSEVIHEVFLPGPLAQLSINRPGPGEVIKFESEHFNDVVKVRSTNARLAYDIIHPRQMEYLLDSGVVPFQIAGNRIGVAAARHDPAIVAHSMQFLAGFIGRIPDFVWKNLGWRVAPQIGTEQ